MSSYKRKHSDSDPMAEKRKKSDENRNYKRVLNNSYLNDDSDSNDDIVFSDDETIEVEDNPGPSTSNQPDHSNADGSESGFIDLEELEDDDPIDLDSENDPDEMNEGFNLNNLQGFESFEDKFDPEITTKTEELLRQIEETEKDVERYRNIIENCDLEKLADKGERQKDMLEYKESELTRLRKEYDKLLSEKDSQTPTTGSRLTMNKLQVLHGTLLSCPTENQREKTPEGLKTQLKPHQEHALAWLLWRERRNPSSGILADDMGLGKTLTMISLIVKTNEDHLDSEDSSDDAPGPIIPKAVEIKGKTLVICPASLLQQWKNEIKNHCHENILIAKIYHGTQRTCDRRLLARYDVVITTYNLVAREYTVKSPTEPGVLSRIKWQRVILDEAHIIRNTKSKFCGSVCDLVAKHRWALTGTPIHNRHDDFYSIIKFLRLAPFDDYATFRNSVADQDSTGNNRLTTFIKTFMLRRTKEELQNKGTMDRLPDRTSETIVVKLDDDERAVYTRVMALSKNLFAQFLQMRANKGQRLGSVIYGGFQNNIRNDYDDTPRFGGRRTGRRQNGRRRNRNSGGRGRGKRSTFTADDLQYLADNVGEIKKSGMVWIFVLILRLRQICCHLSLIHGLIEQNDMNTIGIDANEDNKEDIDLKKMSDLSNIDENSKDLKDILVMSNPVFEKSRRSSKVRAVMKRVEQIIGLKDKMIIVSQWTSFLSIFSDCLRGVRGAKCAVFSGAVNVRDRQTVVEEFNNPDSDTNILLLSLTAGGVGLNLTGGNHILFVDIHWNPQLECQAQDRIYRMGQNKNVFVYKFITDDTIEERVKELQEHKLAIADSILTPGSNRNGNRLTLDDLRKLFR